MKVSLFEQVPYRYMPEGFENQHNSVVTAPYQVVEPARMTESLFSAYAELMHGARAGFDGICVTEHSQSSYDISPTRPCWPPPSPAPREPNTSTSRSPCSAARSARPASR
jgi:hypothetical protein